MQTGGADQAADFRAHLGSCEEVADVVGRDVKRFEVQVDAFALGNFRAFKQRVVH